jgi:hypothetical protein
VRRSGTALLALTALAALGSFLGATASAGETPAIRHARGQIDPYPIPITTRFDFARGIGLVEGERKDSLWVMIADSTLAIGDSLTLISDEPNPDSSTYVTLVSAAVKERLHHVANAKMIPEAGDVFYRLAAPAGALDCCIFGYAVRAPRSAFRKVSGHAEADLDGDKTPEIFQSCGAGDLLYPAVWSGRALTGTLRWKRGYHLDYPVETNCPGPHDSLSTK